VLQRMITEMLLLHPELLADTAPPPAARDVIDSLPKTPVAPPLIDEDQSCPICMGAFVIEEIMSTLPCGHIFHNTCVKAWLNKIPLPNLDDYWLHAVADAPPRTDCTRLLDYVAETWMEGRLSPETWNHFSTNGPRTNNHLEGWHNKLKKRVGASHPHIYKLINIFQKEQAANEVKMVQYTSVGTRRKMSKKYRDVDEKLSNLKADLLAGRKTCVEYGDAASYLLKL
ncbi:hypothetical protein FSP39_002187, partial [Pinctada imbricata]